MGFYGGVVLNVDALKFTLYAVVSVNQPQPCPVIPIAFDISAAKNGSVLLCKEMFDKSIERGTVHLAYFGNLTLGNAFFEQFHDERRFAV